MAMSGSVRAASRPPPAGARVSVPHEVPRDAARLRRAASLAGTALLAALLVPAPASAREPDPRVLDALERAYYDLEVASYCGLVSEAVGAGFRAEVRRITDGFTIPAETLDTVRGKAWKEAHWQWQDHGLGGYRAWCRDEGRAAARRFQRSGTPAEE